MRFGLYEQLENESMGMKRKNLQHLSRDGRSPGDKISKQS